MVLLICLSAPGTRPLAGLLRAVPPELQDGAQKGKDWDGEGMTGSNSQPWHSPTTTSSPRCHQKG